MGQRHQDGRNDHRQENILQSFAILHGRLGTLFDPQVACFVREQQEKHEEPRPPAVERNPKQGSERQLQPNAGNNVKRIHADAGRMLDQEFELIPGAHGRAGLSNRSRSVASEV